MRSECAAGCNLQTQLFYNCDCNKRAKKQSHYYNSYESHTAVGYHPYEVIPVLYLKKYTNKQTRTEKEKAYHSM